MTIEDAKKYIGRQAKYMKIEGEIEDVRYIPDCSMFLVYFAGVILNLNIIWIKNEITGKWESIK